MGPTDCPAETGTTLRLRQLPAQATRRPALTRSYYPLATDPSLRGALMIKSLGIAMLALAPSFPFVCAQCARHLTTDCRNYASGRECRSVHFRHCDEDRHNEGESWPRDAGSGQPVEESRARGTGHPFCRRERNFPTTQRRIRLLKSACTRRGLRTQAPPPVASSR